MIVSSKSGTVACYPVGRGWHVSFSTPNNRSFLCVDTFRTEEQAEQRVCREALAHPTLAELQASEAWREAPAS